MSHVDRASTRDIHGGTVAGGALLVIAAHLLILFSFGCNFDHAVAKESGGGIAQAGRRAAHSPTRQGGALPGMFMMIRPEPAKTNSKISLISVFSLRPAVEKRSTSPSKPE